MPSTGAVPSGGAPKIKKYLKPQKNERKNEKNVKPTQNPRLYLRRCVCATTVVFEVESKVIYEETEPQKIQNEMETESEKMTAKSKTICSVYHMYYIYTCDERTRFNVVSFAPPALRAKVAAAAAAAAARRRRRRRGPVVVLLEDVEGFESRFARYRVHFCCCFIR